MRTVQRLNYRVLAAGVLAGVVTLLIGSAIAAVGTLTSNSAVVDLTGYLQALFVAAVFFGGFRAGGKAPRSGGLYGALVGMLLGAMPLSLWWLLSPLVPGPIFVFGTLARPVLIGAAGGTLGFNLVVVAQKRFAGQRARV